MPSLEAVIAVLICLLGVVVFVLVAVCWLVQTWREYTRGHRRGGYIYGRGPRL